MKQIKCLLTILTLLILFISGTVMAEGLTMSVDDQLTFDDPSLALVKYASFFATDLGDFDEEPLMTLTIENDYGVVIEGYFEFRSLTADNEEIGFIRTEIVPAVPGETSWDIKAGGVTNIELITDVMDSIKDSDLTDEEIEDKIKDNFDLGDIEDWSVNKSWGNESWIKENIFDWTGMDDFDSDDIQTILDLSLPKGTYKMQVSYIYKTPTGSTEEEAKSIDWVITNPEAVSMESPADDVDDLRDAEFSWVLPDLPDGFEVTSKITIWDRDYGSSPTVITREHDSGYDSLYTTTIDSSEYQFLPGRWYKWTVNLIGPNGKAIGGGNEDVWEVAFENTLPEVSLEVVSGDIDDLWEGDQISLAAEVSDEGTPDRAMEVIWRVNGKRVNADRELTYTFEEPGDYEFEVEAVDGLGESVSRQISVTVQDNQAPEVEIINEDDKEEYVVGETLRLLGEYSDAEGDVVSAEWYFNGKNLASGEEFEYTLGQGGEKEIKLVVKDERGLKAEDIIEVSVKENEAPVISIDSPESGEYIFGEEIELSADVSDDLLDELDVYWEVVGGVSIDGDSFTIPEEEGDITLRAWTKDEQGQVGEDFVIIFAVPQSDTKDESNTAPEIEIEGAPDPEDGIRQGDEGVLTAEVSDEDGHEVTIDWKVNYATPPAGVVDGDQLNLSSLPVGSYTITAIAKDELGARSSVEVNFPVKANQAPILEVTDIPEKVVAGEEVLVAFNVNDPEDDQVNLAVEVVSPDGDIVDAVLNEDSVQFTTDQVGDYSVKLEAVDSRGSASLTTAIIEALENQAPEVKIVSPEPGIAVVVGQTFDVKLSVVDPEGDQISDIYVNGQVVDYSIDNDTVTFAYEVNNTGPVVLNLRVTDSKGKEGTASVGIISTSAVQEEVENNEAPQVNLSVPDYGEEGIPFAETLTITADVTDADNTAEEVIINWFVNDELLASGNDLTYSFVQSGTLDIRVEAVDINGARGTQAVSLTVQENKAPEGNIVQPVSGMEIAYQESVVLQGTASDPEGHEFTYTWLLDGNVLGTGNNYEYTFAQAGKHNLTMRLTDSYGAGREYTYTVKVLAPEGETLPPVIVEPLDRTVVLSDAQLSFSAENVTEDMQLNWRSSLDGAINTPEGTVLSPGEHKILLLVDGIQVDSVTVFVIEEEIIEEQALATAIYIKGTAKIKQGDIVETLNPSNFLQYEFFAGDEIELKGNNSIEILFYETEETTLLNASENTGVYRFTEDGLEFEAEAEINK